MKATPEQLMIEAAKSLGEACLLVGGAPVELTMTLGEFLLCYGRNGVVFSVSPNKEPHS